MKRFDKILSELNANSTFKIESSAASTVELNDVHNFIVDNEVTKGETSIPLKYIYATYSEQNRRPMPMNRFGFLFNKFFEKKRSGLGNYYNLSPDPFDLPPKYSFYKEYYSKKKYKYKPTKFNNIKYTPEGWMIFLALAGGRKVFDFVQGEIGAARLADKAAIFYFGKDYPKLNFKESKKQYQEEDPVLLALLRNVSTNDKEENPKENNQEET